MSIAEKNPALPRVHFSNWKLEPPAYASWGPRSIPDIELIYIHKGRFELQLKTQTIPAEANDLLIILPDERHTLHSIGKEACISCIHCDLPAVRSLVQVQPVKDPEIPEGFRRCADIFLHPAPLRDELLSAILSELWIRIRSAALPADAPRTSRLVEQIAEHIREHCCEPFDRTELAKRFHISPQHLNYLFRTEFHTTPTEVLHHERVKRAFLLMQDKRISVKEAAYRTGFYDTYHFSKVFKKAYGFPPSRVGALFKPQ
jgi:AraC-like DNA-binding protein